MCLETASEVVEEICRIRAGFIEIETQWQIYFSSMHVCLYLYFIVEITIAEKEYRL